MSYGLIVYRLDVEKLKRVYGCKELERVYGRKEHGGDRIDGEEMLDLLQDEEVQPDGSNNEFADRMADTELSLEQAEWEILQGDLTAADDENNAFQYSYALKQICESLGFFLDNSEVMPIGDFIQIQPIFDFVYSSPPIPIPDPVDFPRVGHMSNATVEAKLSEFEALNLASFCQIERKILEQYASWLRDAQEHNQGLVVFYH